MNTYRNLVQRHLTESLLTDRHLIDIVFKWTCQKIDQMTGTLLCWSSIVSTNCPSAKCFSTERLLDKWFAAKCFFDQMPFGKMVCGPMFFGQMLFGQMLISQMYVIQMCFDQMLLGQMVGRKMLFCQMRISQMYVVQINFY